MDPSGRQRSKMDTLESVSIVVVFKQPKSYDLKAREIIRQCEPEKVELGVGACLDMIIVDWALEDCGIAGRSRGS